MNVTCAGSIPQTSYTRNLLETAPVDSYANLTVTAKDSSGRPIPSGQVQFRLDHELFYVTSSGNKSD